MEMEIPNSIKIGNTKYNINQVKVVNYVETFKYIFKNMFKDKSKKGTVLGQICREDKEIRILKGIAQKYAKETLFHELAHGIMWEMERRYPKVVFCRCDEAFTNRMGKILSKTFNSLMKSQR